MKKVLTICFALIISFSIRAQDAKMDAFHQQPDEQDDY